MHEKMFNIFRHKGNVNQGDLSTKGSSEEVW
jgi:hypothetical protein